MLRELKKTKFKVNRSKRGLAFDKEQDKDLQMLIKGVGQDSKQGPNEQGKGNEQVENYYITTKYVLL